MVNSKLQFHVMAHGLQEGILLVMEYIAPCPLSQERY